MKINFKSVFGHFSMFGGMFIYFLSSHVDLHGAWQPSQVISNPAIPQEVPAESAVLKVNSEGNAITVWVDAFSEVFPREPAITSAFYTRGVGWSTPQVISNLQQNQFQKPLFTAQDDSDIALNSSNYAVAVWEAEYSTDNFPAVVVATTRNSDGAWSPVTILSDQSGDFHSISINVSLNEAGTALAAWRKESNFAQIQFIEVSFLPFGGSWTPPFTISSFPSVQGDGKPYPVINPSGNAVVTWQGRIDLGIYSQMAATYNSVSNTWSPSVILDTSIGDNNFSLTPRCAMDSQGNAVAIWQNKGLVKTAYFNGILWEPSMTIGTSAQLPYSPDGPEVVMDPNGNITATWTTPEMTIQSSSRSQNGSWSPPQTISAPGTTGSFNPNTSNEALAVNAEGDVIAIWHQTNGNFPNSPVSAFKPFGLNWRPQEIIERTSDVYFTLTTLNIGLASCGFAVATWENSSATLIRASVNENLLTALNPIERLTRCVTVLTWDPNQDSCVLFYRIYRNGILIATIPRGQYRYVDSLGQNRTYEISTINVYGFEGDRIPFVIN